MRSQCFNTPGAVAWRGVTTPGAVIPHPALIPFSGGGQSNHSLIFDGSGEVIANQITSIDNADFTVTFWAKKVSWSTAFRYLVAQSIGVGNPTTKQWAIGYWGGDYKAKFDVCDGSSEISVSSGGTLTDNQWMFFAARVNRTAATIEVSLNGSAWGSASIAGYGTFFRSGSTNMTIGGVTGSAHMEGWIDSVAIYGTLLTDKQVAALAVGIIDPLSLSPVGLWRLNDGTGTTAVDSSGNANDGTLSGGVTWSTDRPIPLNHGLATTKEAKFIRPSPPSTYSLLFDGSTGYVDFTASTGFPSLPGVASWSFWVKLNSLKFQCPIWDNISGQFGVLFVSDGSVAFYQGGTVLFFNGVGSGTMQTHTWYHVGIVRTGSSGSWTIRFFVNGIEDDASPQTTATDPAGSQTHVRFGQAQDLGTRYLNGYLDDIAVWTSDQSANFVGLAAETTDPSSLSPIGLWRLNEGAGNTTVNDSSGNGNIGTLSGGVTWSTDVPYQLSSAQHKYKYRKKITISNTDVDLTLANYPVEIKFASDTDIGSYSDSSGLNIKFTSDDGQIEIPYERRSFSVSGGAATGLFFVKVPFVFTSIPTNIWIYYKADLPSDQSRPTLVWDSGYGAVWHLDESSGNAIDTLGITTLTNNNSVGSGTGKIGGCRTFVSSSSQFLDCVTNPNLTTGDIDFSIEVWINLTNKAARYEILGKLSSGAVQSASEFTLYYDQSSDRFIWTVSDGGTFRTVSATTFGSPSTGTWYRLRVTHNSVANLIGISVNGGTLDTASCPNGPTGLTSKFAIGRPGEYNGLYFNGSIDEVLFSRIIRSNAWGKFAYHNESDSDNALTYGTQQYILIVPYSYASTAQWPLNEVSGTRFDSIGSNDLTDNNTVGSNTGIFGLAADFEKDNSEYLSIADNADLSTGDIDYVIGIWVNLESKATTQFIACKDEGSGAREYQLYYDAGGDRFAFSIVPSGFITVNANTLGSPSTGVWYYIQAQHSASKDKLRISVNAGAWDETSTGGTFVADSAASFYLGRLGGGTPFYFDGMMSDGLYIKDYEFNSEELSAIYNDQVPFVDWPTGPVTITTYNITAVCTFPHLTTSVAATFVAPIYSATAADTIGHATTSITATFATASFHATAADTIGRATTSVAATFVVPTYHGTAADTIGHASTSVTVTFVSPIYTGTASDTIGHATTSGVATFVTPTYNGTASDSIGHATTTVTATFVTPTYHGSAVDTIGHATTSGTATFVSPIYSATAADTIGHASTSAVATFVGPTYTVTASNTIGHATTSIAATFVITTYIATASCTFPHLTTSIAATFVSPVYTASASDTIGHATTTATAAFALTSFNASAADTIGHATTTIAATFSGGTDSATASCTFPHLTTTIAATFVVPTYHGTAADTIGHASTSVTATFVVPTYHGSAADTIGHATTIVAATFSGGTHTATASDTIGHATTTITSTFLAGTHTATASDNVGHATTSVTATFAAGTHTATATDNVGHVSTNITATFVAPIYHGTASNTIGHATTTASSLFSFNISVATATNTTGPATTNIVATFVVTDITISLATATSIFNANVITPELRAILTTPDVFFNAPPIIENLIIVVTSGSNWDATQFDISTNIDFIKITVTPSYNWDAPIILDNLFVTATTAISIWNAEFTIEQITNIVNTSSMIYNAESGITERNTFTTITPNIISNTGTITPKISDIVVVASSVWDAFTPSIDFSVIVNVTTAVSNITTQNITLLENILNNTSSMNYNANVVITKLINSVTSNNITFNANTISIDLKIPVITADSSWNATRIQKSKSHKFADDWKQLSGRF